VLYTEDKHLLSVSAGIAIVDPFAGLGELAPSTGAPQELLTRKP